MAQPCGYGCNEPWIPWAGSALKGHARCRFSPEDGDALLVRYEADPRLSVAKLSQELGESVAVVRAALKWAQRRRRKGATDAA